MNSASPRSARRRVAPRRSSRASSRNGIASRWRTVIAVAAAAGAPAPVSRRTSSSIRATIRSASSSRPWRNSQRGLSGTWRRTTGCRGRGSRRRRTPAASRRRAAKIAVSSSSSAARPPIAGADPEAAVDREVDAAAVARRDQLVDRRVDRGVLAADAHAGQEPEDEEVPGREREGGRDRGERGRAPSVTMKSFLRP